MTHAFDERPTGDVSAGSSAVAEGSAPARSEQMLAGPTTLEPRLGWTPVLIAGLPDDAKPTENRPKSGGGGGRRPPRRRLRGLDGLRAIAVLAVVFFHLDFSLAPGGFLGVDVFFVISGFLITNLLATEILTTGAMRLGRFYVRRARRLLPTVLVFLAVVSAASLVFWRDQLATIRGGVLSSLTYSTNWWLIWGHQSYFVSSGRPSMVQHLWSLAIEEQYYIVWSVAVMAMAGIALGAGRTADPARRLRFVVITAGVLAGAATLAMTVFAVRHHLPYDATATSRVYFGSDTHSMGLFLGSAAGAWLALRHHKVGGAGRAAAVSAGRGRLMRVTDLIGVIAAAAVVYQFFDINEYTPGLYRGGFLVFGAAVLVAILCATRRGSLFGRVLDIRPLQWVGRRSYSIYIWHWPVCIVTRPGLDVHGPDFFINFVRLALILALAALSYRFVEGPLRSGQFIKWRRDRKTRAGRIGEITAIVTAALSICMLLLSAGPADATGTALSRPPGRAGTPSTSTPSTTTASIQPAPRSTAPDPPGTTRTTAPAGKPALSAYGDSVLLGAGPALQPRLSRLRLDAVVGRQASDVLADVLRDQGKGTMAPYVLIHMGDNGIIDPDQLKDALHALRGAKRVLLMTVRVPRDWQDPNNNVIRSVARRFKNVTVVDWHKLAGQEHKWLDPDGLHLTPSGQSAYAAIVMHALK